MRRPSLYQFTHWCWQRRTALLIGLLLTMFYLYLFAYRSLFEIHLQTFFNGDTNFKVYWAEANQGFSEKKSKRVRISEGDYQLKIFVGHLGNIEKLRIDPIEYSGEVAIKAITLSQNGFNPLVFQGQDLAQLLPLRDIESASVETGQLRVTTNGKDANLQLNINAAATEGVFWTHIFNIIVIVGLCILLRGLGAKAIQKNQYVVLCLTIAVMLATVMAVITTIHVHPDEQVHLEAIEYYGKHFLPPPVDSPEITESFSHYGKSRLSTYEIYYPLAGYFTRIIAPLKGSQLIGIRSFNLLIFFLLLVACVAKERFRYFALPLIISPQVWYLYSYPNSEGFALALGILAAYQLAVSNSALNRFLSDDRPRYFWLSALGFGVLAGCLLLSKINFYFLLLFLFLYFLWRIAAGYYAGKAMPWLRIALISLVAVAMYGGRYALDVAANGPDPKSKVNEYIELHAKPEYKPSTPLHEKHAWLYMKEKGISLDFILDYLRWGTVSFTTAFGSYGYTQYFGSDDYYFSMKVLLSLLLGAMIFYALVYGPPRAHGLILLVAFFSALLMGAAIWSSWAGDFQAQGRYLAPIIPTIGIVYYHFREYVQPKVIAVFALGLFLLSTYSFIFIGLGQIAKTSFQSGIG